MRTESKNESQTAQAFGPAPLGLVFRTYIKFTAKIGQNRDPKLKQMYPGFPVLADLGRKHDVDVTRQSRDPKNKFIPVCLIRFLKFCVFRTLGGSQYDTSSKFSRFRPKLRGPAWARSLK